MRDRIFTLLKERRISQKELARRIQVSPQTITDWKKGNSPSFASMIGTLSIALNTTPGWLSSGQGQKDMSEVQREEKADGFLKASMDASRRLEEITRKEFKQNIKRMMQRNNLKASDFADPSIKAIASFLGLSASDLLDQVTPSSICVPVLGTIPAGIPLEAIEDIQDWEEVPASWADGGREYFGLQVKGDSMYPQYLEGDTVILRKSTTCDSGDDCAVLVSSARSTQLILRAPTPLLRLTPCLCSSSAWWWSSAGR